MKIDRRITRWLGWGRSSQALFALSVMLGLAGCVLAALQARSLSQIIAGVFLESVTLSQLTIPLRLLLGFITARAVLTWGQEVAASAAAIRIKTRLRQELYEHILALGPSFTRDERSGELLNTAFEGVESLQAYFGQYLPQLVLAALLPLLFLAFILPLDWLSVVVLVVTAPLMPLFMILIGSTAEALTRRQWKTLSRISAYFLDVLQGITTLKAFGQAQAQVRVIGRLSDLYTRTTLQVLRITFLSALALEMLSTLGTAVVAVEVGLRLLYGRLGFEQAFFVLLLAPEFYLPLRLLGGRFHAGMAGVNAAERILEILERPVIPPQAHPSLPSIVDVQSGDFPGPKRLAFEQVSYAYPGTSTTLSEISFEVRSGQRVALVGPSGAGKSTLAALLLRFIKPDAGRITLDGKEIDQVRVEDWRQNIAWVPQQPYLFNDSLRTNICIARPGASQADVVQAVRLAHAEEFIDRLPQGYETIIGERGYSLSAGQAQRIALARAFLKNAPILILDEATSNLDPRLERLVGDSLERLMAGRIVLILAHRMATAARADHILVLDNGRLIESGTHESLLKQGGFYKQLLGNVAGLSLNQPETGRAYPLASESHRVQILPGLPPGPRVVNTGGGYTFWRLLRLIRPFTGWIALAVLLGALTVGSGIGLMAASAYLICAAALHPSISVLQVAIVGVRAFGISRGLFRYLERYVSHKVTFQALGRLRAWFYQALEPLAPACLMGYRSGDLLSRVMSDFAELENFYVRALAPPLVALVIAATTALYIASFSTALAGTYLIAFILGGIGVACLALWLGRKPGGQIVELRSSLSAALLDGILGLADLLAMSAEQRFKNEIVALDERHAAAQMRLVYRAGWVTALGGLIAGLGMWVLLVQAIPIVTTGRLPGVYLASILLAALASFEAAQPLPTAAQYLENQLAAARRLFEIVAAAPAVQDPDLPIQLPKQGDLRVEGLSFAYPSIQPSMTGGASLALEDISFHLPPGGRLGIVGPSGAGKSTLAHLMLRFWEYRQGSIRLGEAELCKCRGDDVRQFFSLVSQQTDLFNTTIRENLLVARPDASPEMIFTAAQGAQIHDFILSLPEGYDTWIGEQGVRLSGGERQRLAVARALLKDAPLLLLDEPTANLDPLTERHLLHNLFELMKGRTTLLITHRLVGLEAMDEILVLDQGRVVERGSQAALIQAGGFYFRMWELQNQLLPGDQDPRSMKGGK